MYPKNDELCASILIDVIRNNNESRMAASSNMQAMNSDRNRNRNQVYALRQKMFGSYVPNIGTEIQSRTASTVDEGTEPLRNKVFELRRVMFGRYS